MAVGIAHVWNHWGIQILVVLSFVWQVVLLVSARIRRRRAHVLLRLLLWLVYLLADSTAIYALGHLSFTSSSRKHRLAAFWAPFLLVHLGGPDSITAYSLEDNRLWLRHLFTLSVQVMGAAFVIYKYVYGTGTLILLAASMMFVVGVLKYGERTWALKCGNMDSIRGTVESCKEDAYRSIFSVDLQFPFPGGRNKEMSEDALLLSAHSLFHMCKSLFADLSLMLSTYKLCSIGVHAAEDLYKLVELELSLMYDILYTKATVIHTWYGYCIRVVSLLGTFSTFLLFLFSDKSGYNMADVVVSYVLLAGALVVETISVIRTLGSTWTCAMLYCKNWQRPLKVLKSLRRRRFIKAARTRWWSESDSIGQYNMFHLCTRDTTELGSRVACKMRLKDKWNKMHFSGTVSFTEDLKKLLLQTLPKIDARDSRGTKILDSRGFVKERAEWSYWALNTSFDESIIVWHIATEIYLCKYKEKLAAEDAKARKLSEEDQARKLSEGDQARKLSEEDQKKKEEDQAKKLAEREKAIKLTEAIQVLSNYMMYLLVAKPDMLPGPTRQSQYANSCNIMDNLWHRHQVSQIQSDSAIQNQNNPVTALKKVFHRDGPNDSRVTQREMLAEKMRTTFSDIANQQSLAAEVKSLSAPVDGSACIYGLTLAEELLRMESNKPDMDLLQVIFEVWVQILCYAAHHCSRDSHARRLNSGGEFITVVWLLTLHILMQPHLARKILNKHDGAIPK